jgi:hypothetical protein
LDHADLSDIADGTAKGLDELLRAMSEAQASLVVSWAHVLDLAEADPATVERWVRAATSLGPLRYAVAPGDDVPMDRQQMEEHLRAARPYLEQWRIARQLPIEPSRLARDAYRAAPKQKLAGGKLRQATESALDDLDPALLSLLGDLGVGRDELLSNALATPKEALDRGDISEWLRRRRVRDHLALRAPNDVVDEAHLEYAVHAEVFTADSSVVHHLTSQFGKLILLRRDGSSTVDSEQWVSRFHRTRSLRDVASTLTLLGVRLREFVESEGA